MYVGSAGTRPKAMELARENAPARVYDWELGVDADPVLRITRRTRKGASPLLVESGPWAEKKRKEAA